MSKVAIATSGGNVGWQVDLLGLALLVLSLCRAGLKCLTQAGVDFHTIVRMGETAKGCPAPGAFRKR